MELIPADGKCIVAADGTIVWADAVFYEWFSFRGIGPGSKFGQLFPGSPDVCKPGAIFEDADRLGKRRYFAMECKVMLGLNGEKVSEDVRIRKITLQRVLNEISRLATQTKSPSELFEKVLWLLRDTTPYLAFAGYIAEEGRVRLVASKGWTEKLKSYVSIQDIAPDSTSIAGRTAYHRKQTVMAMKDYALSPAVKSAINKLGGEYIVVTPLVDQDKLVGVLTVINDKVLTPVDSRALQAICQQIASALSLKLIEDAAIQKAEYAALFANLAARAMSDEHAYIGATVKGCCPPEVIKALTDAANEKDITVAGLLRSLNDNVPVESMPLKDAVAYAIAEARKIAEAMGKKLSVKVSGPDHIEAGPLLRFAAYEILKNSVRHSSGTAVNVDIHIVKERAGAIRLEISDNGPGIPDEFKSEVFRLYKANMKNPGGMGLYLVKRIASRYGGRVWVEDRVHGDHKKGASMVITIPAKS